MCARVQVASDEQNSCLTCEMSQYLFACNFHASFPRVQICRWVVRCRRTANGRGRSEGVMQLCSEVILSRASLQRSHLHFRNNNENKAGKRVPSAEGTVAKEIKNQLQDH